MTRTHPTVRYVDPQPLIDAALAGRPRHQRGECPYCHGRTGAGGWGEGGGRVASFSANRVTIDDLADILDESPRQIIRWLQGVRIDATDLDRLDRYATAVGSHPLVLWPELDTTWAQVAA